MNFSLLLKIIRESIKSVPAVKYALGIAGIISVIALIKAIGVDKKVAVFGTVVMIMLMILLLVFSKLTVTGNKYFLYPSLVLLWTTIILTLGVAVLLFTSMFFATPLNFKDSDRTVSKPTQAKTITSHFIGGRIIDKRSNEDLAAVDIEVNGEKYSSDMRGNFNIDIPDSIIDKSVTMVFQKKGYHTESLLIKQPETDLRIQLEKNNNE